MSGLKKNIRHSYSVTELKEFIKTEDELSISEKCELLGIARSSIYYKPVIPTQEEVTIKSYIDKIYTSYPFYGYRRITAEINRNYGVLVNHKRVLKYMQEMGIQALYPRQNTSKPNPANKIYPYLLRNLVITQPNHVWGIDITYIPLKSSWMYLVAVLDWRSRFVVAYELSDTLEIGFVLEASRKALTIGKPIIINSDQGSHFTSPKYTEIFLSNRVAISMDHRGRAFDNIFTERLWRTVKYEDIYLKCYETPRDLRNGLGEYMDFYNHKRLHQSLAYCTPAEIYYATLDSCHQKPNE